MFCCPLKCHRTGAICCQVTITFLTDCSGFRQHSAGQPRNRRDNRVHYTCEKQQKNGKQLEVGKATQCRPQRKATQCPQTQGRLECGNLLHALQVSPNWLEPFVLELTSRATRLSNEGMATQCQVGEQHKRNSIKTDN